MLRGLTLVVVLACLLSPLARRAFGQPALDQLLEQSERSAPVTAGDAIQENSDPADRKGQKRIAVPQGSAASKAIAKVRDVFHAEYTAATTPETKAVLAGQLLSQALQTPSPVERWALYAEAIRFAADAGDAAACFEIISTAASEYAVDEDELKLEALSKLAMKAQPQAMEDLSRLALELATKWADAGDTKEMAKALGVASSMARKTRNAYLAAEITKVQRLARDRQKEIKETEAIENKLKEEADSPEVCLEAGRFFCFERQDWHRGLPLLAKGSDLELQRLAMLELQQPAVPMQVRSLADAWWDWADGQRGTAKTAAVAHAAELYASIIASVQGLERTRIEKRIQIAGSDNSAPSKRVSLAQLNPASTDAIAFGFQKDGTFMGKPYTCGGQQWPNALTSTATGGRPATIVFEVPGGAKRLRGKVGVFLPQGVSAGNGPKSPIHFEVVLDGRSAWKSRPLPKENDMDEFDVPLFGARRLELRASCDNAHSAWAAWLDPEIIQ